MFNKNDKRRLYWLIDIFLAGKIDESTFCDEFYYSYSLELNHEDLTEVEGKIFKELHAVSSRFSKYEEDIKLDPHAFTTKEELIQKIKETSTNLKEMEK